MTERRIMWLGLLAAALVLVTGWLWLRPSGADPYAGCRQGAIAGGTESLGTGFQLTDETGARVSEAQVFDRPTLFYMGYTYCPDVCPMDGARNAEALDLLKARGIDAKAVFMSVDPRRDTPERLREFTDYLHPDMLGITGTADEVAAVAKGWRSYFRLNDAEDKENYLVDHMTTTYLVLPGTPPRGGTVEFFTRDTTPEDMANRTACFVERSGLN